MTKGKKILLFILIIAAAAALMVAALYVPYHRAQNAMVSGAELTLEQQADGKLLVSWPKSDSAEYYRVQVLQCTDSEDDMENILLEVFADVPRCALSDYPADEEVTIRVDSVVDYQILGQTRARCGENPLVVATTLTTPTVTQLHWIADPETKTVTVSYRMRQGDYCRFTFLDKAGDRSAFRTLSEQELTISFAPKGDLVMPDHGESIVFVLDAYRKEPGVTFYGNQPVEFSVVREDLLDRELAVEFTDIGDNQCTLSWNETKGAYYEVQAMKTDEQQWTTFARIPAHGERTYSSPHLEPCEQYSFRVVALGGQTMENSDQAAVSSCFDFATVESPIFATIWPTKELEAYADSGLTEVAGMVKCGQAYCVLEESDGLFGIMVDGQLCYIDSNYCMINLPEYMGEICSYDITNSYHSLYMVHEYQIPNVTGVVTGGYEKVKLSNDEYLVPLLYPTAKKLAVAAKAALSEGYRLKIYDAFRPQRATKQIYDRTARILENPLPYRTYTGRTVSLPKPEGDVLTYEEVMTGGVYSLGSFLANGGSLHNLGIALDLTLEDAATGEELRMQTSMHDLSFYSVLWRNNNAANTLAEIMKGAGFAPLTSEWWHFQDDEIRAQLGLPTVWEGINAECWMADDNGWRYRRTDGSYYSDCVVEIGNASYSFDADGYVISD